MLRAALALQLLASADGANAQDDTFPGTRERGAVLISESDARAFQQQFGLDYAIVNDDGHVCLSAIVVYLGAGETVIEAAFACAYSDIGRILERAGASWHDIVDIMSLHTDLAMQFELIAAVQRRHIAEPFPAWTAIQIDWLIPDQGVTEIKIVARNLDSD